MVSRLIDRGLRLCAALGVLFLAAAQERVCPWLTTVEPPPRADGTSAPAAPDDPTGEAPRPTLTSFLPDIVAPRRAVSHAAASLHADRRHDAGAVAGAPLTPVVAVAEAEAVVRPALPRLEYAWAVPVGPAAAARPAAVGTAILRTGPPRG